MWQAPETDCWLHPDVAVRRSPIAGEGLFALAARQPDPPYIDTITVTDELHLVLPPGRPNGKGNHSCDPNLWWTDAYTLAARRDIVVDEELTNDYATSTGSADFVMACRCGSARCRGTITGHDWQLADLRQRYGEHWVPALLARMHR